MMVLEVHAEACFQCSKASFNLLSAEPRSRGFGWLGAGFHPIFITGDEHDSKWKEIHETYHVDDLERCGDSSIFVTVKF